MPPNNFYAALIASLGYIASIKPTLEKRLQENLPLHYPYPIHKFFCLKWKHRQYQNISRQTG